MSVNLYGNLEVYEGTVTSETTVTFNLKPRKIILTNDSASNALTFKFNSSETAATLKPTETITLNMSSRDIILNSASAPYRLWGLS